MPARKKTNYVFATTTTLVMTPGRHHLTVGQAWHADHPIVAMHPELFSEHPIEVFPQNWESPVEEATAEPEVEQATAAPREKRATRRAD